MAVGGDRGHRRLLPDNIIDTAVFVPISFASAPLGFFMQYFPLFVRSATFESFQQVSDSVNDKTLHSTILCACCI